MLTLDQNYSNYMESAQMTLLNMRNEEIKRREEYMRRSGQYLPPFFHELVPSLRMKPLVTQVGLF